MALRFPSRKKDWTSPLLAHGLDQEEMYAVFDNIVYWFRPGSLNAAERADRNETCAVRLEIFPPEFNPMYDIPVNKLSFEDYVNNNFTLPYYDNVRTPEPSPTPAPHIDIDLLW